MRKRLLFFVISAIVCCVRLVITASASEYTDSGTATEIEGTDYVFPINSLHEIIDLQLTEYDIPAFSTGEGSIFSFYIGYSAGQERNIYAVCDGWVWSTNNVLYLWEESTDIRFVYCLQNTIYENSFVTNLPTTEDEAAFVEKGTVIGGVHFSDDESYRENTLFFGAYNGSEYIVFYTGAAEQQESVFGEESAEDWSALAKLLNDKFKNTAWESETNPEAAMEGIAQTAYEMLFDLMNKTWILIPSALKQCFDYSDQRELLNTVLAILTPIAYSLSLVLWLVGILRLLKKENIDYATKENGIKIFGGVLLLGFWVSMSASACLFVIKLNDGIVTNILNGCNDVLTFDAAQMYIEPDMLTVVTLYLIVMVIAIVEFCAATVKLILRQLELMILISVSPVFFGFIIGEESRKYFWKFGKTLISVTIETLFMAAIYVISMRCWNLNMANLGGINIIMGLGSAIMAIMIANMIRKPPQCFKDIIGG